MEPMSGGMVMAGQDTRRGFLGRAVGAGVGLGLGGWFADRLAAAEQAGTKPLRGKSLIVLWLDGGPSQLETFDPHPGTPIAGPGAAIATATAGLRFHEDLPRLAKLTGKLAVIRSLVSKEGDHERGRYHLKTGFRMNPAVTHPALGAIAASQLGPRGDLPAFVSFMTDDRQTRGGYLGDAFDPFRLSDPGGPVPDVAHRHPERLADRRKVRAVLERSLATRNPRLLDRVGDPDLVAGAKRLMESPHLTAFRLEGETAATRDAYGHAPFGKGCLLARRLVEQGVRCVEVQLGGWDAHADNFKACQLRAPVLDAGFSALVADLADRGMLQETVVLCVGEFGRTPKVNGLAGRDHWPTGFSAVLAGGAVRPGVVGQTFADGRPEPRDPVKVEDLTATVLAALGLDPAKEVPGPLARPIRLSDGVPVKALVG